MDPADLRPTDHAARQMRRRRISRVEVAEAMANSGVKYPSGDYPESRTVILGIARNGRRLKIVVPNDDPDTVITVADRDREE